MVAQHNQQAFELLVQRHRARAYRLAYSVLGNDFDTRDILQEAFVVLFKAAHKFDGRSKFSKWFYRILVNLCIDHQPRGKWWIRPLPLARPGDHTDQPGIDPPAGEEGPDAATIRHLFSGRLGRALKRLSANQRMAVLLRVQEGFSSAEIAEVLNCTQNNARVHTYGGLAALKSCLEMDSDAGRPS
jgi:RNA polymerase sigma-70 factor (ECF subfamily)